MSKTSSAPPLGAGFRQRFQAAGFAIDSDIELAYLLGRRSAGEGPADVVVSLGEPPPGRGLSISGPRFALTALEGREIVVAVDGASPDAIARLVLTAGLTAIAYQRGLVPLHASGVAVADACVAFCGESEAGKSTLAAGLARAGYPALADDLVVVHPGAAGGPRVWPGERLKLDSRAIELIGGGVETAAPFSVWDDKAIVSPGAAAPYAPHRLACLYLLGWGPPAMQRVPPSEAVTLLGSCLRSRHWLGPGGAAAKVRQGWLDLVAATPVVRVTRPRGPAAAAELAQTLIAAWRAGNLWLHGADHDDRHSAH